MSAEAAATGEPEGEAPDGEGEEAIREATDGAEGAEATGGSEGAEAGEEAPAETDKEPGA